MTYSRDSAERQTAILSRALKEIRDGQGEPDCTWSGHLKPGAAALDQGDVAWVVTVVSVAPCDRMPAAPEDSGPAVAREIAVADPRVDDQGSEASHEILQVMRL